MIQRPNFTVYFGLSFKLVEKNKWQIVIGEKNTWNVSSKRQTPKICYSEFGKK